MIDSHAGTSTGKAGLALRFGTKMEDGSAFRATLNRQRRDGGKEVNGKAAQDEWNNAALSFRYDKPDGSGSRWLVSGRIYDTESGDPWLIPSLDTSTAYNPTQYGSERLVPFVSTKNGGDLLGRFERSTEGGGEIRVQTYVEKFHGAIPGAIDDHSTMDLDAQHRFLQGGAHDIVWGANYRQSRHSEVMAASGFLTASGSYVTVTLASIFAQDEWTIIPRRFNVQAGLRVEHQTFGGTAPQPSVRALWTPSEKHSLWFAWSKTVRSPSVVDRAVGAYAAVIPATASSPLPMLLYASPGEQTNFGNEKVRTIEAGHRAQWTPTFFSDLTAYVSKYDDIFGNSGAQTLRANDAAAFTGMQLDPACTAALNNFGLPTGYPGLCIYAARGNKWPVRSRGLELSTEWTPLSNLRLQMNASRMWLDGGTGNPILYGNSPNYQGSIRSSYNFTADHQFDVWLRRVGGLSNVGYFSGLTGTPPIAARNELDLRYAHQVNESLELSLTLQNLLSKQKLQFYPDYMPSLPVVPQRTIYLKAVWHDR
jgi:iron complex outermembrane receptor protein